MKKVLRTLAWCLVAPAMIIPLPFMVLGCVANFAITGEWENPIKATRRFWRE